MNVVMTKELFKQGKSLNGGCNKRQVECLGEDWPLEAGWMGRIIGREYPEATIARFVELRTLDNKRDPLATLISRLRAKGVQRITGKAYRKVAMMNSTASKSTWQSILERWQEDGFPDFEVIEPPPEVKKKKKRKVTPQPPAPTLKQSYAEYLDSDLWNAIRRYVLFAASHECVSCSNPATQVHHRNYDELTMRGRDVSKLVAICGECHQHIHFDEAGVKAPMWEVDKRLKKLLSDRGLELV